MLLTSNAASLINFASAAMAGVEHQISRRGTQEGSRGAHGESVELLLTNMCCQL